MLGLCLPLCLTLWGSAGVCSFPNYFSFGPATTSTGLLATTSVTVASVANCLPGTFAAAGFYEGFGRPDDRGRGGIVIQKLKK